MSRSMLTTTLGHEIFIRGFFPGAPDSVLAQLADRSKDRHLAEGEVLFRPGDPADNLYFVVGGLLELTLEDGEVLTFGERSGVGVTDVLLERARTAKARALRASHTLELSSRHWFRLLEESFEFARGGFLGVSGSLAEVHEALLPDGGFPPPVSTEPIAQHRAMDLVERVTLLREVPLFRRAGVQPVVQLAQAASEERYDAGSALLVGNAQEHGIVVPVWGRVRAAWGAGLGTEFGRGTIVGGPCLLAGRGGRVRATTPVPTALLRIPLESYFEVMEEHTKVIRSALASFILERERLERLRRARSSVRPSAPPGPV